MMDVSHQFALRDGRSRADSENAGRNVLFDYGITEPYVMALDSWVRAPIRITHSPVAGFLLEIADLDFSEREFRALEEAVIEMRRIIDTPETNEKETAHG